MGGLSSAGRGIDSGNRVHENPGMQANIKIPSTVYAVLEDRAKMARITIEAMLERIISDHVASFSSSGSDVISAPLVSRGRFEAIHCHPRFAAAVT